MVERDALEGERRGASRIAEQRAPRDGARDGRGRARLVAQVRDDDDRLRVPGARRGRRRPRRAVDVAIAVPVAVDGEQHPRLDLGQPVDDRPDAELRRARRPHGARATRWRGTRRSSRGCWAGTRPPGRHGRRRARRSPARQRATASRSSSAVSVNALARLRHADDDLVRARAPGHRQRVLGVAQRRAREPARAGHAGIGEGGSGTGRAVGRPDVEVVPDRLPERARLVDRPAPRGVVVLEREAPLALQPAPGSGPSATGPGRRRAAPRGRAERGRRASRGHGSAAGRATVKDRGGSRRSRLVAVPVKVSAVRQTFCHAPGSSIASA